MSVRMRHTKGHTGNRRGHHALSLPRLSKCPECGESHIRHQVCMHCGMYRGRRVVDVTSAHARVARRAEKKLKERGLDPKKAVEKERVSVEK